MQNLVRLAQLVELWTGNSKPGGLNLRLRINFRLRTDFALIVRKTIKRIVITSFLLTLSPAMFRINLIQNHLKKLNLKMMRNKTAYLVNF